MVTTPEFPLKRGFRVQCGLKERLRNHNWELNVYLGWLFGRGSTMKMGAIPKHPCALSPPVFSLLWVTPGKPDGSAKHPSLIVYPPPAPLLVLPQFLPPLCCTSPFRFTPPPLPFPSSLMLFQNLSSLYLNLVMTGWKAGMPRGLS